jgi:hypothetical protein
MEFETKLMRRNAHQQAGKSRERSEHGERNEGGKPTCWNRAFGDPLTDSNVHTGAVGKEREVETKENEGST